MLKVENMVSERSGRAVANQFVITDTENGITTFQSYDSTIVSIDRHNKVITVYDAWDYSMTTGKYRNQFMYNECMYAMSDKKRFEATLKAGEVNCGGIVYAVKMAA